MFCVCTVYTTSQHTSHWLGLFTALSGRIAVASLLLCIQVSSVYNLCSREVISIMYNLCSRALVRLHYGKYLLCTALPHNNSWLYKCAGELKLTSCHITKAFVQCQNVHFVQYNVVALTVLQSIGRPGIAVEESSLCRCDEPSRGYWHRMTRTFQWAAHRKGFVQCQNLHNCTTKHLQLRSPLCRCDEPSRGY